MWQVFLVMVSQRLAQGFQMILREDGNAKLGTDVYIGLTKEQVEMKATTLEVFCFPLYNAARAATLPRQGKRPISPLLEDSQDRSC